MDTENAYRDEVLPDHLGDQIRSDEELISNAFVDAHRVLGLSPHAPYPDKLGIIRLWDNLSKQFGGDEELMRHWVMTGNKHLRFTPYLHAHNPRYLLEMNEYLESFLNR